MKLKDLTDQWLIKNHFFGMYIEDPADGKVYLVDPTNRSNKIPSVVIQSAIDAAVSRLEMTILASIRKEEYHVEYHDYDSDLFNNFGFICLDKYPVAQIRSLELVYGEHGSAVWTVPSEMIQTHSEMFGTIQLLPFSSASSSFDPAVMPFFSSAVNSFRVPSRWKVTYDYGMDALTRDIDPIIIRTIELMAAVHPLNIMGDIIIGAGIASISTSFDGISQSVNTTASAENAALSARIVQYRQELYGDPRTPGLIQVLQSRWRRIPLAVL